VSCSPRAQSLRPAHRVTAQGSPLAKPPARARGRHALRLRSRHVRAHTARGHCPLQNHLLPFFKEAHGLGEALAAGADLPRRTQPHASPAWTTIESSCALMLRLRRDSHVRSTALSLRASARAPSERSPTPVLTHSRNSAMTSRWRARRVVTAICRATAFSGCARSSSCSRARSTACSSPPSLSALHS
jgi:hypothetical protein